MENFFENLFQLQIKKKVFIYKASLCLVNTLCYIGNIFSCNTVFLGVERNMGMPIMKSVDLVKMITFLIGIKAIEHSTAA